MLVNIKQKVNDIMFPLTESCPVEKKGGYRLDERQFGPNTQKWDAAKHALDEKTNTKIYGKVIFNVTPEFKYVTNKPLQVSEWSTVLEMCTAGAYRITFISSKFFTHAHQHL